MPAGKLFMYEVAIFQLAGKIIIGIITDGNGVGGAGTIGGIFFLEQPTIKIDINITVKIFFIFYLILSFD